MKLWRWAFALLLLLAGVVGHAQSFGTTFWLDPQDANSYAEFTRREYRIATKHDAPKVAANVLEHQRVTFSMLPTPETGQTGNEFWTFHAPEWWKRVSQFPPGSSKGGQASQNVLLSKMWVGLSAYQRTRATLRAAALAYQSLKGLRFEVDAWQMMKNLLVMEEGIAYDKDGKVYAKVPQGSVSISIVPRGKESWRPIVAMFNDHPWDDGNHGIKFIGPTSLSDVALEANELGGDPLRDDPSAMVEFLEKLDAGARTAAEGILSLQLGVDERRHQAMNDAFSPIRLATSTRMLNRRLVEAYGKVLDLRSILEGRDPDELQKEYQNLVIFADNEAKAARAQAEMSAKFYSDLQNQAANVMAELELPKRLEVISKIEKEYAVLFNTSNKDGLLKDIDDLLKNINSVVTSLFPAMAPYVGGLMLPIDTVSTIKGSFNDVDNDKKNPKSDIQGAYRDARIRALAVRLNWILFEELRAVRRLAAIQEQVAAANHGLNREEDTWEKLKITAHIQNERAVILHQLRLVNDGRSRWGAK